MWRQEREHTSGGGKSNTCSELIELTFSISSMLGPSSCSSSIPVIAALLNTSFSISLRTRPRRSLIHFPGRSLSLFIVWYGISPHSPSQRARGVIVLCWNRWCFTGPPSHAAFGAAVRKSFWYLFFLFVLAELFRCNVPDDSYYCSAAFAQTVNDD